MHKLVLLTLLVLPLSLHSFFSPEAAAAPPRVVVSIKPLHSLVAGIMLGVAEPQLLIKGGGSPHGYMLRPSQARTLANADLLIWAGEELETFLLKPLSTLGKEVSRLELLRRLEPELLPERPGGFHEDSGQEHAQEAEHFNAHFWLDPLLAKRVVSLVLTQLVRLDPEHQQAYEQNAASLQQRLNQLHQQLKIRLATVREIPYLVFHDAYAYFEQRYGLNAVAAITVSPERTPGARRISAILRQIKQRQVRCLFSEPQFEPRMVARLMEGSNLCHGSLDPLGAELRPGPESYFTLLNRLADNLLTGLGKEGR